LRVVGWGDARLRSSPDSGCDRRYGSGRPDD
jgi:hypothetical protein